MTEYTPFYWPPVPRRAEQTTSQTKQATCNTCFEEYSAENLGRDCEKPGCEGRVVDPKSLPNF